METVTTPRLVADPGSIGEIAQSTASRRIGPVEFLDSCLRRIDAVETSVQGWCRLDREGALAQARALQHEAESGHLRSRLHGIPVAVKDVLDVAGLPTCAGSKTRAGIAPSTIDAEVVTQLRIAGAIILGKAHTTEFAYFDGPPPTRNPHNLAHTPGGSSAGPAAVVAAGMVPLSLGTQTAGSVNRPAAYCGIAGFKPSTRSWPSFGLVPFAPSFDTVGVFGHRVSDVVTAAQVLIPPYLRGAAVPSPPFSIAVVEDPVTAVASPAVAASARKAADALAGAGLRVERRASPVPFMDIIGCHKTIIECEVARAHPGLENNPDVSAGLREAIARGRAIDDAKYMNAWLALKGGRERFWTAMTEYDALLFPAAPDVAPAGMKTGDPQFIVPFTALGGPIISVPVGFGAGGLPLGVMLIGAPGTDAALTGIASEVARVIELPR
jgi:aspartyl-tRNA(Asn)/glutamyl-tRNA(Gln) amidotransferase subunit A